MYASRFSGLVLLVGVALAAGSLVAPVSAAPAASAPTGATASAAGSVRAVDATASPYATSSARMVTVTSGWQVNLPGKRRDVAYSRISEKDGVWSMYLRKVTTEVSTEAFGRFDTKKVSGTWRKLGDRPTGIVQGVTKSGQRVEAPVVFTSIKKVNKTTYRVRAVPQAGTIPSITQAYVPNLEGVSEPTMPAGYYRQLAVTASPATARTWKWSSTGSGSLAIDPSTRAFEVRFTSDQARGAGVQPNGASASAPWSDVAAKFAAYAGSGVTPRLAVTGTFQLGKLGRTQNVMLQPSAARVEGGALVLTGVLPFCGVKSARRCDTRSYRTGPLSQMFLTLETAGNGNTRRYVVVAGDSIASGEGARYGGTYVNPSLQKGTGPTNTPTAEEVASRVKFFCDTVDLACTAATIGSDGKVTYEADPGRVYETGSWEKADQNEACHRSRTAPGTWLARYLKTQRGQDVEPIVLACSGATTANIIDTPFKGQNPQSQDLRDLAAWVPVSHVVTTIGANDIRFSDIALACLTAPVQAILGSGGGPVDAVALLNRLNRLLDDTVRTADGSVRSLNPYFEPNQLCSTAQRSSVAAAIAAVRGKVAAASRALHEAAPDARIVMTNYPSLVPASANTYWPRQPWLASYRTQTLRSGPDGSASPAPGDEFAAWVKGFSSDDRYLPKDALGNPDTSVLSVTPQFPFEEGILAGNRMNLLVAQNVYAGLLNDLPDGQYVYGGSSLGGQIFQTWGFSLTQLANVLNHGAVMFGFDQDWAAKEVIPALNVAVLGGLADADGSGQWSIPVDMTQLFNGRELGGQFVGHGTTDPNDEADGVFDVVWGQTGNGAGPTASRAQYVNNIFSGQTYPFVCPDGTQIAGIANPRCIGDPQEALHPNWRGQAAEGQCIVAVVTGLAGPGNACVRSVGDGSTKARTYQGADGTSPLDDLVDPTLFSPVAGDDSLCVTSISTAQAAGTKGEYLPCANGITPDPTWDTERWERGKVTWQGARVHWR